MKRLLQHATIICVLGMCATQAFGQAAGDVTLPPLAQDAAAAPSPQALSLARALVAKAESTDVTTLPWLGVPIGMFMQRLHITPREHARIVFHEALVPVLQKHAAELAEIEAQSYAADMSVDELKAVNAFYDSPAGLALLRMHAPLLRLNEAAILQLLETLKPEIQTRTNEVLQAHGWTKGLKKAGGDEPSPPDPPSITGTKPHN